MFVFGKREVVEPIELIDPLLVLGLMSGIWRTVGNLLISVVEAEG